MSQMNQINAIDDLDLLSVNICQMNSEELAYILPQFEMEDIQNLNLDQQNIMNIKQENADDQLQQQQQQLQQQPHPVHWSRFPNLDPITSVYEFETTVPPENTNVVFQQSKLFIKRNSKMTINVAYRRQLNDERIYVRAMLILSQPAIMHEPVKRCANHRTNSLAGGTNNFSNEQIRQIESKEANILKVNDPKAIYFGCETGETFDKRLSVVTPLESNKFDENGKVVQSISLEFGCQNSCSSGINRRPTSIVFTLEKSDGSLVGKSATEFKVCSCPKRDAEREQSEMKRKSESTEAFPRGKRPKYTQPPAPQQPQLQVKPEPETDSDSSSNNEPEQHLMQIIVSGTSINLPSDMKKDVSKCLFNLVAGKMAEETKHPSNYGVLEKAMKELKKLRRRIDA